MIIYLSDYIDNIDTKKNFHTFFYVLHNRLVEGERVHLSLKEVDVSYIDMLCIIITALTEEFGMEYMVRYFIVCDTIEYCKKRISKCMGIPSFPVYLQWLGKPPSLQLEG